MKIKVGSFYELNDRMGRNYGQILVTDVQESWIIGTLEKGPDFCTVAELFLRLEEIANFQMLSLLDGMNSKLEEIEFCISDHSEKKSVAIIDVQVMSENDISFKLRERGSSDHD